MEIGLSVPLERSGEEVCLDRLVDLMAGLDDGHSRRVYEISERLMGLTGCQVPDRVLRLGTLLHDVGKLGISRDILDADRRLTEVEMTAVRRHPVDGVRLLYRLGLHEVLTAGSLAMVLLHHERFDGTGYPFGVEGDDLHMEIQCVCLADTLEALSSRRAYKPAWTLAEMDTYLEQQSGRHFSPDLTRLARRELDGILG